MKRLFAIACCCLIFPCYGQSLLINEIMSDNGDFLMAEGQSPDWIELFNSSDSVVLLSNFYLSDAADNLHKWQLPGIHLPPQSFQLIYASGANTAIHSNFKINKNGEGIYLSTTAGVVDSFPAVPLNQDESYGRFPDGSQALFIFQEASPHAPNIQNNNPWVSLSFSKSTGRYSAAINLELSAYNPNSQIHYTTDGSIPTLASAKYIHPLQLTDSSSTVNNAYIPTADNWSAPKSAPFKGAVIRAAAFIDSNISSSVYTHTYFIHPTIEEMHSLPIISIVTDSTHLFSDEAGIYVDGNHRNFSQKGREWERPAHLQILETDGRVSLSQNIGIRTYGYKGRTLPQKSLLLYARSSYGTKRFKHALFPEKEQDSFKRLILRSASSNDWKNTLFKNELTQRMVSTLNLEHPSSKAVIAFVNGEYWGIHHLSERMDEHFLEDYYGHSSDSLDYLSGNALVEEGSNEDYLSLLDFIQNNSLSNAAHYQYVASRVDLSNFIDYNIAELFLSNTDWPNNNIKFWKSKRENGKWRWLFFDCDECMSYEYYDLVGDFLNEQSYHEAFPEWSTTLLHHLFQNDSFKQRFRSRFEELLSSTFSTHNMLVHIDSMKTLYAPEVSTHAIRWNAPMNLLDWEEAVDGLYSFAAIRPTQMRKQLHDYLGTPFSIYPNPSHNNVYISTDLSPSLPSQLFIYDSQGVLAESKSCCNGHISTDHLRPGVYLFRIRIGSTFYSESVVVR